MRIARSEFDVKGSLLSAPLSNPKIAKNSKENGVNTYGLHLSPEKQSGGLWRGEYVEFNTCASASDGCKKSLFAYFRKSSLFLRLNSRLEKLKRLCILKTAHCLWRY